jgi:probable addiction module antidote protein
MARVKTSDKQGFSFEKMPELKLKRRAKTHSHDSAKRLGDSDLVGNALIQALKDGDAEAFKEILAAHLSVTNKDRFSEKSKIPRRTLFRILSPEGNPTLENVARIVHALSKAA